MEIIWTFENENGELYDATFDTRLEAIHEAEADFEQQHQELAVGEQIQGECYIVSYSINDDGEQIILSRDHYPLFVEWEGSDYAEHNTHWGLR